MLWLLPGSLVLYALAPNLWTAAACIFLVGALYLGALSSFTSSAQARAPAEIRGRVSADGDNDIGLYAGLEHADTRLSRRHLQWRAPGQLRTLRPTPELGANADLQVSVGSVTRVTAATLLLGIGPRA